MLHPSFSLLQTPLYLSLHYLAFFFSIVHEVPEMEPLVGKKARRPVCFFAIVEEGGGNSESEATAELASDGKADDGG